MKILKRILLVVLILIALPFIIALFVKNDYEVQRDITINRPEAEVFDYIKHLKNQDNYNVWSMADPNIKMHESGTDGTVGFVYGWESEEVGVGEQEIKAIAEGERVDMELRFKEPFEGIGQTFMATEEVPGGTKVTWNMKGESSYPMNFMNLFNEGMLGGALQGGLENMKKNLEK